MPWINITNEELAVSKDALQLLDDNPTANALVLKIEALQAPRSKSDQAYIDAVESNDELEVDPDAIVSTGSDAGAWVMALVWVTDHQAGLTLVCAECGEAFSPDEMDPDRPDTCRDCAQELQDDEDAQGDQT